MKTTRQRFGFLKICQYNTLLVPLLVLGVCADALAQSSAAQNLCCDKTAVGVCIQPMPARPSASRVSEAGRYGDLHKRMDKLDTGNCANAYYLHKTQAWLNLSRDFYHEGDGAAAVNAAYDEAEKLIKALEDGKAPSSETMMIQDAAKLRPDLWEIAAKRKATPSLLSSAAREVAYCEVYLVRAGHAQTNLGGKARVEPLIGMAQDICAAAQEKPTCPPIVTPIVQAPVVPAPQVVVTPQITTPLPPVVVPVPVIAPTTPTLPRKPKQDRN